MIHGEATAWTEGFLGLFFPPVCQICHAERTTAAAGYLGPECRARIRRIHAPFCQRCGLPFAGDVTQQFECSNCRELHLHFTYARAAAEAKGALREVIHQFKYHRALWFRPLLTQLLLDAALPVLRNDSSAWQGVVPVPLHAVKAREREFNQAELLARPLADTLQIPLHTHLIRRITATGTQTTLSREARAVNVHHAFALVPGAQIRGQRLIVVDDVFTTGATTNAVAQVLRAGGAAEVVVWAVARGV